MTRRSLISGVSYGALLAGLAQSAVADNLTVTNGTVITTPLATNSASNGSAGNITIEQGATVRVSTPGAALTLNSNNDITHAGLIEELANSDAIGVHIVGGFAGNFTAQGAAGAIINITGSGTGNYGLLLDGASAFTGNIRFEPGSSIIVYGENSVGIAIDAPLTGNLVSGAAIQGIGVGTTAVRTTAAIGGSFINSGALSVRGITTFTAENVDPLSGSGIAIGASVSGGFLNSGPLGGGDGLTPIGRVTNSSTAPAVVIAPSVAGSKAAPIVLAPFIGDTARLDFSFMNRGNISATQNDVGISTTGVRLGETSAANFSVLLNNGFYNRGSINSSSSSDNVFSTTATAVPTNATGLEIGYGATVNAFKAPDQPIDNAGWATKAASGSTATTIVLGADASDTNGIYKGFQVDVGGEARTVTDYVVVRNDAGALVSKTLTLSSALSTAPAADAGLTIKAPPTDAIALGATASDVAGVYNGFTIEAGGDKRIISDYVVILNPVTNTVTMRVAKIEGLSGQALPWNSTPAGSAKISTSALFNAGAINAFTNGTEGGAVNAILIQPSGTLPSITNYGAIDATARTTDTSIDALSAIAINDQSGTLTEIANYGRIQSTVTTLDNGAQVSRALDLSHASASQSVSVLGGGDIIGDVVFGSGAGSKLVIEGSITRTTATGTVEDTAALFGAVRPTGTGTLGIEVSRLGTGGLLRTSNVRSTTLIVGPKGVVAFALAQNSADAPVIQTTGIVDFDANSQITLTPTSFLPANGTYTLISAGGGFKFANFAETARLNSGSPFPFLLEGAFTADGTPLNVTSTGITGSSLDVSLRRKSAAELGLQGNDAAIYEPLAAAALVDNDLGSALLTLDSAAEVQAAIATTVPDIAGGMRALTVAMTDQATGVIGARQRALLTAPAGTRDAFRFWGQEFYNLVSFNGTTNQAGYNGGGLGVALGVEWGTFQSGRLGFGYTFYSSQEVEEHPRDTKTNGDWNMLSAYGAWRFNNIFIAPQINAGIGDIKTRRAIQVNNVIGRSARSKSTTYLASGGTTAGYVIDLGNIDIIPTIAFDVLYLNQGAYNESGGGALNLSLKSQNQTSVRSFAGIIGQGSYTFNEGAFMPQLLAGWSHEFVNDPATIDGSFESSPGSPFHLVGPTLDANKIVGGMSLGYVMRNWSAGFNYDAAANAGTLSHSATFSISSRF